MVQTLSPPDTPAGPPPARRRGWLVVPLAIVAGLALAGAVFFVRDQSRGLPTFASLAEHPDPTLQGTVAYVNSRSRCVRIVAAAGQPAKDVFCLPQPDMSTAAKLGTKEDGPQLVWLADGLLEVTMFRSDPKTGTFFAGWQKIVDVRSGQVRDVTPADVPATPNLAARPTVTPDGRRVAFESAESSGRVKVTVTDANGTRTVLSARGPGQYSYRLRAAFWAPNWQWIAADDGRILVIAPGEPSLTRVLTDETRETRPRNAGLSRLIRRTAGAQYGDDPRLASFAVTDANLLTP